MNKRHYEHTLPNIRGSLSNTYDAFSSGSRPHPGTAGPQATAYAVETLAER